MVVLSPGLGPFSLVSAYECSLGTYCPHLQAMCILQKTITTQKSNGV
jgi:hypothetical protein